MTNKIVQFQVDNEDTVNALGEDGRLYYYSYSKKEWLELVPPLPEREQEDD